MLSNQFWYGFAIGDGIAFAVIALGLGIVLARRRYSASAR
jgi:uncharacterized protein (TIGR03382 family)